ncbi:MAG: DUF2798 domain-containing protein [Panacagrimonas sp.]
MIPVRFAPLLFSAILSGLMSLIVSAISTLHVLGFESAFMTAWLASWSVAWAIAFPAVAVIAPITRKLVDAMTGRT